MALQILLLLLVPYAMPLLMPSWRWLLAYTMAVALLVTLYFTAWYYALMATPTRTGLEGIGLALVLSAAISTAIGAIVRVVTLVAKERSVVIGISILGAILLPFAVLVWANR
ncbi:hypothetical protein LQG66_12340 [Bradyrhizobium ontarionense]|uniref:Uncharacterized protein n=1 Tax=Bradyrhizobium ontarionense TaxID=2898149 RepID=A0ABY3RJF9_9BRAD|nr:hypothetical protein [Bradyrhizobium sp. A19]UFZ07035.1 hypothetical protein LQG66_12340 [Bradyrhizobium sp. A19]